MPKTRTRTIAVVAGLGAAVLVLGLALNWRTVSYAIYPEARLWGRCKPIESERGDLNSPPSRDVEITAVEFRRQRAVHVEAQIRILVFTCGPAGSSEEILRHSLVADLPARDTNGCVVPAGRVLLPDMSARGSWSGTAVGSLNRKAPPRVLARFRFDDGGRLILEHDEPFLPGGGRTLTLERAPEGE